MERRKSRHYDVIVIGVGAMGSATCWQLAKRGLKVLGLEQFRLRHECGSSHGATRLIRQAYFEHPDYVPLLRQAYRGWEELMTVSSRPDLFVRNGIVLFGRPESTIMQGCLASSRQHSLNIIRYRSADTAAYFPWISLPPGFEAILEPNAGFLRVEACNQVHAEMARSAGATIVEDASVKCWDELDDSVKVETATATYTATRLVVCAGAWAAHMLPALRGHLNPHRVTLHWFHHRGMSLTDGRPCFGVDTGARFIYGVPAIDADGVKLGDHTPGDVVADPSAVQREVRPEDARTVEAFQAEFLPALQPRAHRNRVCLYTMTQDQHFVVDRYPGSERVVFGAGFSGHGFKFAPVIGSALADLAMNQGTDLPIDFLRLTRF